MRKFISYCLCALAFLSVKAQDVRMEIPDAYSGSVDSLAFYIDSHCADDEAKLQALYRWITTHMKYNVFPTFVSVNEKRDEQREIMQALANRQGVCRDFAKIFEAVGTRMDIPVYFVKGYTKSGGVVMTEPHAWCVALVNDGWYNYDPTFGMGYIRNQRFVSSPNMDYCKVEPEKFLQTHMPFDPIWQLTPNPYAYHEFDDGEVRGKSDSLDGHAFRFADSIRISLKQTPVARLQSINGRIRRNGRPNPLVDYYLQLNESNMQVYRQREVYDIYKRALKYFNRGVDHFNEAVRYQRVHPRLGKNDKRKMIAWLDKASEAVAEAGKELQKAHDVPEQYATALDNLKQAVAETMEKIRLKNKMLG